MLFLLMVSPMCTPVSTWQRISAKFRSPVIVAAEKNRAVEHSDFGTQLYRKQLGNGRDVLHEQPAHATPWQEKVIKRTMCEHGVETPHVTNAITAAPMLKVIWLTTKKLLLWSF